MINRDIRQTLAFKQLAVEFKAAVSLDATRVLANLPANTLLLDFVNVSSKLSESDFRRAFPKLTKRLMDCHNNNPLAFDWYTLGLALDQLHGHTLWESSNVK